MYQTNFVNFNLETSILVFLIFIKEPNLVAPSVYDAESSVSKRQIIILIDLILGGFFLGSIVSNVEIIRNILIYSYYVVVEFHASKSKRSPVILFTDRQTDTSGVLYICYV